jgi:RimJ/RimL family protein N-acetyltransferase
VNISGTCIVLRDEWRDSDNDDFFHWHNLEEWNYYDEPDKPFKRIRREDFQKQLEEARRHPVKPSPHSHSWQIDTIGGRHIGWVNYYHLDQQAKRVHVGICIPEEKLWGKGYGTEAMTLLIDHLFADMALEDIRITTWTGNRRMIRCAQKSGFKELARITHRAEYSVRGEPLERIEFSISRQNWLAQRDGDR